MRAAAALALGALGALAAAWPGGFQAATCDCTLEGTADPKSGRPVEVQELSRNKTEAILDEVESQFGAAQADEIRYAIHQGRISVGEIPPWGGIYGTHDWNTIGISPSALDPAVAAIVLVHEWDHVEACGGGPSQGGTTSDPDSGTSNNPCGPVNHMGDTSDSIHKACERLENADAKLQEKLCKMSESWWMRSLNRPVKHRPQVVRRARSQIR